MKTIHLKTILFSLLLMTGNPIAFANEDPCSAVASADKLDCIKTRIEEAEASVESQFTRLSQPGPQGVKGKKGPMGLPGETGDSGGTRDTSTEVLYFDQSHYALIEDYRNFLKNHIRHVYNWTNGIGASVRFDEVAERMAKINRNPRIMGNGDNQIPFARNEYGTPLEEFYYEENGTLYRYYFENNSRVVGEEVGTSDGNYVMHDPCTLSPKPPYCGSLLSRRSTQLLMITNATYTSDPTPPYIPKEPEISVVGIDEYVSYNFGMTPDDALFQHVLDKVHYIISDNHQLLQALIRRIKNDHLEQLIAEGNEAETDQYAAMYNETEDYLSKISSLDNKAAKIQLANLASKSDVIHFYLVSTLIGVYLDYRHNNITLTADELASLHKIEDKFAYYMMVLKRKWRDVAYEERERYWDTTVDYSLAGLFASPTTPDFIKDARTKLEEDALAEQSAPVQGMWEAMEETGVSPDAMAPAIISGIATAMPSAGLLYSHHLDLIALEKVMVKLAVKGVEEVGDDVALQVASKLGIFSNVGKFAAGPFAIITTAITIGIEGGKQAFKQAAKEEAWRKFMAQDFNSPADLSLMTDEEIGNAMYMWLTIELGL